MKLLEYFRRAPKSASTAKDRLSIIVARERTGVRKGPDYLPQLQQELLAVIARFEKIDMQHVTVTVDRTSDGEVLELNIVLPDGQTGGPTLKPHQQPAIA
jgi:cell division topological specificity factor